MAELRTPKPDERDQPTPRAHSFQVWSCGHCPNAHILLLSPRGEHIAELLLTGEQITLLRSFQYAMRHNEFPSGVAHRFLPK